MSCCSQPTSKHAFVLSWISTILTAAYAAAGFFYYVTAGSAMCLVFGLENFVDFLSSVVVLWRFWASGTMTKERENRLKRRDLRASMAISFIMIVLGMAIVATSTNDMKAGPEANTMHLGLVLGISGTSVFVFGGLSFFKFQYASALSSESLYKDAVCSMIGTILGLALFSNTLIVRSRPQIWWLDPIVAMLCGLIALFLGIHSMYVAWKIRRVPIFALSWWTMSRGDGQPYRKSEREALEAEERAQKKAEAIAMAKKKKAMAMAKKKKMKTKSTKTKKTEEQQIQEVEMKPINSTNLSNDII